MDLDVNKIMFNNMNNTYYKEGLVNSIPKFPVADDTEVSEEIKKYRARKA